MALSLPTVSISLRMDSLDLVYGVSCIAMLSYLQVEKDIALLDMLEIGGYGTDNFTLRFRDKKDQPTISVSTGSASNLIQVIRAAYGESGICEVLPHLQLPPDYSWAVL